VHDDLPLIDPGDRSGDFWIVQANAVLKRTRAVCAAVGCIAKEQDGRRTAIGTGWLVAERTLVTNAHVAAHLAIHNPALPATDPRGGWRLRPDVAGVVSFAFEHGGDRGLRLSIEQVLYVERATVPDIAVFRLKSPERAVSLPTIDLDLVAARPAGWLETYVFAVGHPLADLQNDQNVAAVFGALDGTKRLSPGQVTAMLDPSAIAHDCSTTNGSSGSPLIDFASCQAIGLHYFGKPGERNEAIFMPALAGHPAIVKSLSRDWGI
jgi:hypothetical protein